MEETKKNNYYNSLNKLLEFIDLNLSGELGLNLLSKIAGYSEFHFHRIFHSVMGKSVLEYVIERKYIAAASRVLYDKSSTLTQIALDYGFTSSSSFSRGFKKYFKYSPSEYKRNKNRARPVGFANVVFKEYCENTNYNELFFIKYISDIHGAGIAVTGLSENWDNPEIEQAFQRLFEWIRKNDLMSNNLNIMGLTLDSPEVQTMSNCRYYPCVEIDQNVNCEGDIIVRTFNTEGRFVCFTIRRDKENFADRFFSIVDYLYGFLCR
jgi:AraC family transcriptional regulator